MFQKWLHFGTTANTGFASVCFSFSILLYTGLVLLCYKLIRLSHCLNYIGKGVDVVVQVVHVVFIAVRPLHKIKLVPC